MTVNELKEDRGILRKKAFIHTILFLIGFSIIFLALGLTTSFIGSFFLAYQGLLRQLGAVLLVFFGLILTGVLRFNFLLSDKKIQFQKRPTGYFGSILIGLGFAAGWTPCTRSEERRVGKESISGSSARHGSDKTVIRSDW